MEGLILCELWQNYEDKETLHATKKVETKHFQVSEHTLEYS